MNQRIKVGISSCLLGNKVRYDGGHKLNRLFMGAFARFIDWVPVCPEVECGLPVPREPMRLVGDPSAPRLITEDMGLDHTDRLARWMKKKLRVLEKEELRGFIFKSRSPSCGIARVDVYRAPGESPSPTGTGLFAAAFMKQFPLLPVEEDQAFDDPPAAAGFIERVLVLVRGKTDS